MLVTKSKLLYKLLLANLTAKPIIDLWAYRGVLPSSACSDDINFVPVSVNLI